MAHSKGATEENLMKGLCSKMWEALRKKNGEVSGFGELLTPLSLKCEGGKPSPEPGETGGSGRGVGYGRGEDPGEKTSTLLHS